MEQPFNIRTFCFYTYFAQFPISIGETFYIEWNVIWYESWIISFVIEVHT